MKFSQKLEMRQGQTLVMTPQLLQAIKLLQLSTIDLAQFVEAELESNPLLERAAEDDGPVAEPVIDAASGDPEVGDWLASDMADGQTIESRLDTSLENVYQDEAPARREERVEPDQGLSATSWTGVGGGSGEGGETPDLEAYVAGDVSLRDHLAEQFQLAPGLSPADRMIGLTLIDSIDEAGYLIEPLEDFAARLAVAVERIESVLRLVQGCEPTGVGARNLAECLRLQLEERDRFDPAMAVLLDHLPLLARRDFVQLRKLCGVDEDDLIEMVDDIRKCDPKPGLRFGGAPLETVIPDVFVRRAPDKTWLVELNSEVLPRVLVNQTYAARVSSSVRNDTEKSYIAECLQSANWLTRSLEQRAKTILKVASEIVRRQEAFLEQGVEHLRPLNLRAVADAITMHESTVSRVTSNKYIATPRGLFEMKYFFTAAIAGTAGGETHSAEAVRHRIKTLIDNETPDQVLSDDVIVQKLREMDIDIARRTVAKYREGLRIPSSVERRREKQALTSRAS
jgi:RNA polymerase sigma-54 factor